MTGRLKACFIGLRIDACLKMKQPHCPRTGGLLASNDVEGYRYYSCAICNGLWIPGHAITEALTEKGAAQVQQPEEARETTDQCPDCGKPLLAFSIEGVTLDSCPECSGIWLDYGEATRLRLLFPGSSEIVRAEGAREPQPLSIGDGLTLLDPLFWILLLISN